MSKAFCKKPFHTKDDPASGCFEAIAAEEFCLVDKKGSIRASLGVNEDGQARLLFFDKNEKLRISFCVEDEQLGIELLDENEKTRAALGLGDNGQPSLLLLDKDEKVHASLEMGEDGGPGLDLYDKDGELRASLSLFRDDDLPHMALVDKNGQRRNVSGPESDGQPFLVFNDKVLQGKPVQVVGELLSPGSACCAAKLLQLVRREHWTKTRRNFDQWLSSCLAGDKHAIRCVRMLLAGETSAPFHHLSTQDG